MTLALRIKIFVIMLVAVVAAVAWLHFNQPGRPYSESRLLMDTVISIRAYPADSARAVDQAFAAFAEVEARASFHRADSDLSRLNGGSGLPASSTVGELLELSGQYHDLTGGYFDPTFALLQRAYGFYDNQPRLPAAGEIAALLAGSCGLKRVLGRDGQTVRLASGSLVDLGGIAGGYAVEKAKKILHDSGCAAFLIDDAGDIWFEGVKPDGRPWRIAVRDPRDNGALAYVESATPMAISTSGDYERYITVDGRRYGHIMNPLSGRPVDYYSSVTVVAHDAVAADALSTAVFAMPPERAFAWVEEKALPALFLTATGSIHISAAGRRVFSGVKTQ